jgi:hypothetical protein
MDPFLEDSALWADVHGRYISALNRHLSRMLAPHFLVRTELQVYIVDAHDALQQAIIPDTYLVQRADTPPGPASAREATPATLIAPDYPVEVHERSLKIIDKQSRRVVTLIELLSPTNKAPGTTMRESFLRKRTSAFAADTHWIEIDLLRGGERPKVLRGEGHYYALLHRAQAGAPFEVWFFDLYQPLPVIRVPLTEGFPDYLLDLQELFTEVYAEGRYDEELGYTQPVPPPRLTQAEMQWVQEQVAAWGRTNK